jgi:ribonucleotide monophosphatase NagD (HAD superfamily)
MDARVEPGHDEFVELRGLRLLRRLPRRLRQPHQRVVGDRLDTDIKGAADLGWDSLLVFTGIAQPGDLATSDIRASFTGDDLSVLFDDPPPRAESD